MPRRDVRILDAADDATKSIFHRLPVPGEWVSIAHILLQHSAVEPHMLYPRYGLDAHPVVHYSIHVLKNAVSILPGLQALLCCQPSKQ